MYLLKKKKKKTLATTLIELSSIKKKTRPI